MVILEQTLPIVEQSSLPTPVGVWPLNVQLSSYEIGQNEIPTVSTHIGYDPRWTPASMLGSAIFSGYVQDSYIDLQSNDESEKPLLSDEITILAWIKVESATVDSDSMTMFDFRNLASSKHVKLCIVNGLLTAKVPDNTNSVFALTSPGYCCLKYTTNLLQLS